MPLFLSLAAAIGLSVVTMVTGNPNHQSNLEMQQDARIQASVEGNEQSANSDASLLDKFKHVFTRTNTSANTAVYAEEEVDGEVNLDASLEANQLSAKGYLEGKVSR